jgi:uncharacterized membrane protein required for colicin V production
MIDLGVKVIGAGEIEARFKQSSIKTRTNIATAVAVSIMELVADTKLNLTGRYLNVITGLLRNSVFHKTTFGMSQIKGTVGTNAWYGRLWHQGFTRKTKSGIKKFAPRPYLSDALEARKDEITQRILKSVEF